jgi:L-cysteine desulfidase
MKILDILHCYVKPSMGCTEPAAVALAAATARQAVGGDVERVGVVVDSNVFRNGLAVGVPGAGEDRGNLIAAALGAVGGDPALGLEVLSTVTGDHLEQARALVAAGSVTLRMDSQRRGPYVETTVDTSRGTGRAIIEGSHTRIRYVERDGKPLQSSQSLARPEDIRDEQQVSQWLRNTSVAELVARVEQMDRGALEYALQGVAMNQRAAKEGLLQAPGLAVGARLAGSTRQNPEDMHLRAQSMSAAAVDARMAGLRVQVMTSSGSGNQGIIATLAPLAVAQSLGVDSARLGQAVALGHVLLARISEELGLLTPLCGSSVQTAAAASGAITWLMGGDAAQVEQAASVTIGLQASILCDGAKWSCALKAAGGADVAVRVALLTLDGLRVGRGSGVIGSTLLDTVRDVGLIAKDMEKASQHVLDGITRNAP